MGGCAGTEESMKKRGFTFKGGKIIRIFTF